MKCVELNLLMCYCCEHNNKIDKCAVYQWLDFFDADARNIKQFIASIKRDGLNQGFVFNNEYFSAAAKLSIHKNDIEKMLVLL